jgi:monoterpene epsilon-lactone hydrolase
MHRKLRSSGIAAELHVFEAMPHGGFGGGTPDDLELTMELRRFLATHWE